LTAGALLVLQFESRSAQLAPDLLVFRANLGGELLGRQAGRLDARVGESIAPVRGSGGLDCCPAQALERRFAGQITASVVDEQFRDDSVAPRTLPPMRGRTKMASALQNGCSGAARIPAVLGDMKSAPRKLSGICTRMDAPRR